MRGPLIYITNMDGGGMKKKKQMEVDEWEGIVWLDDMPVRRREKKKRGWGLTQRRKMIKFLSATGQ